MNDSSYYKLQDLRNGLSYAIYLIVSLKLENTLYNESDLFLVDTRWQDQLIFIIQNHKANKMRHKIEALEQKHV